MIEPLGKPGPSIFLPNQPKRTPMMPREQGQPWVSRSDSHRCCELENGTIGEENWNQPFSGKQAFKEASPLFRHQAVLGTNSYWYRNPASKPSLLLIRTLANSSFIEASETRCFTISSLCSILMAILIHMFFVELKQEIPRLHLVFNLHSLPPKYSCVQNGA